jgi:septum formation protein
LLAKLHLPFQSSAPDIDETPLPQESASETARRLSVQKAQAVAHRFRNALIIGSDQVAQLEGCQLGKPLTHEKAAEQLKSMRGKTVIFHTALSLLNAATGDIQTEVEVSRVSIRSDLTDNDIETYLLKERPYNCAGSAKSEGLGIALISRIEGDDPNALIGLPLIHLITMLKKQGVKIL